MNDFLHRFLRGIGQVLEAPRIVLYDYDERGDAFDLLYFQGYAEDARSELRTGIRRVDPRRALRQREPWLAESGALVLPLRFQEVLEAFLVIEWTAPDNFPEEELSRACRFVSRFLGLFLSSSRLPCNQRRPLSAASDLERAREVQVSYLPREYPAVGRYEIFGYNQSSALVGGGYFDYFCRAEDSIQFVVADACGARPARRDDDLRAPAIPHRRVSGARGGRRGGPVLQRGAFLAASRSRRRNRGTLTGPRTTARDVPRFDVRDVLLARGRGRFDDPLHRRPVRAAQMARRGSIACLLVSALFSVAGAAEWDTGVDVGYRTGRLDWSIAGTTEGDDPNVLSELVWDDLGMIQVRADGGLRAGKRWVLRGAVSYGSLVRGDNRDSDYAGDNRTLEFSRSDNGGDGGRVLEIEGSVGIRLARRSGPPPRIRFTPRLGYRLSRQDLRIRDGNQTLSDPANAPPGVFPPPVGPIAGLDSRYEAEWKGPWVGLEIRGAAGRRSELFAEAEVYWFEYYAQADWNLRDDLAHPKSFEHDAAGNGLSLSAGWRLMRAARTDFVMRVVWQDWSTDPGATRVFLSDGTKGVTRLNGVHWESLALSAGLTLRF